jgi:cytochrome c-type biogenesis protein CcmH/NrfG
MHALIAAALTWLAPMVVRACPMCFSADSNQSAFLYGSLFLMIVPVTAIGSLLYWAYRRARAQEEADQPPHQPPRQASNAPHVAGAPVLHVVDRR